MIRFDLRDFQRVAKNLDAYADQIPFALAQAMNDGLKAAREEIIQKTWPEHVQVRNSRFMSVALRREFANKRTLRVALYDNLGRGNLLLHETGGSRKPLGTAMAVPNKANLQPRRRAGGVPKGLRPKALPNSFKKQGKFGTEVIYQRTKKGPLKLMYSLERSTPVKAEVPFHADFERVMRLEVARAFGPRLKAAMASRRKK